MLGVPDAYELPQRPGPRLPEDRHRDHAAVPGGVRLRPVPGGRGRCSGHPGAGAAADRARTASTTCPCRSLPTAARGRRSRSSRGRAARPSPCWTCIDRPAARAGARRPTRSGCRRWPSRRAWTSCCRRWRCTEVRGLHPADWPGRGRLRCRSASWTARTSSAATRCWWTWPAPAATWSIVGGPQSRQEHHAALADLRRWRSPTRRARCSSSASTSAVARCAALDGLPHISGVAGRRDTEAVRRTVAEVVAVLDEREARFAQHGIDSVASYRRRAGGRRVRRRPVRRRVPGGRRLGHAPPGVRGAGADRSPTWPTAGSAYGVHVVITAARWAEIRIGMRDLLGTKLELRLGDPAESEIDRRAAHERAGAARPGRGLTRDKLHFLAAVSRIDGQRARRRPGRGDGRRWSAGSRRPGRADRRRRCGCCRAS